MVFSVHALKKKINSFLDNYYQVVYDTTKGGVLVAKVKKTLTLEDVVIDRVQEWADMAGISLSGAFAVLATQHLDAMRAADAMADMKDLLVSVKNSLPGGST